MKLIHGCGQGVNGSEGFGSITVAYTHACIIVTVYVVTSGDYCN